MLGNGRYERPVSLRMLDVHVGARLFTREEVEAKAVLQEQRRTHAAIVAAGSARRRREHPGHRSADGARSNDAMSVEVGTPLRRE